MAGVPAVHRLTIGPSIVAIGLVAAAGGCSQRGGDDDGRATGTDASTDGGSEVDGDAASRDAEEEVVRQALPAEEKGGNAGEADAGAGRRLSREGLYVDFAARTVAPGTWLFAPTYELWSDGAGKRRWMQLPPGKRIDTSDMDHWRFPVGTRFWKEFSRGAVLLETRLIEKTGPGDRDFFFGAFVWTPDQKDALLRPGGARDVNGTDHDVPSQTECWTCHQGDEGRILGFSALQLSRETEARPAGDGVVAITLAALVQRQLLSHPPPAEAQYGAPGPPVVANALGYLHANCGHCHNPAGLAYFQTLNLRLSVAERQPEATAIYQTTVGVKNRAFDEDGYLYRVVPGSPQTSSVVFRMSRRGDRKQMPPLATESIHPLGIEIVAAWIASLPARGLADRPVPPDRPVRR
jgi:hypothetical protein